MLVFSQAVVSENEDVVDLKNFSNMFGSWFSGLFTDVMLKANECPSPDSKILQFFLEFFKFRILN